MSLENVEVVRRWLSSTRSADPEEAKAAVAECCDADVDYYPVRKFRRPSLATGGRSFRSSSPDGWKRGLAWSGRFRS
jgi:hypothetical protein